MKNYRVYRKSCYYEYKDVEAENKEDAEKHKYDPREEWIVTDSGYVCDCIVSEDLERERGQDIFIEKEISLRDQQLREYQYEEENKKEKK